MPNMNSAYRALLDTGNYLTINKTIINVIGIQEAVYLGALIDRETYAITKNRVDKDGFFKCKQSSITGRTTLSAHKQNKCLKKLKGLVLIDVVRKGSPPINHFKIRYDNIVQYINKMSTGDNHRLKNLVNDDLKTKSITTEKLSQYIYKEKVNIKKNKIINNSPENSGGCFKKESNFSLSSIPEKPEKSKTATVLTEFQKIVLAVYKKNIYGGCSAKTKTIVEGIPRAEKMFKAVFAKNWEDKLLEAISKYSNEDNYINNHKSNLLWFAPKSFFSKTFIENYLITLVFNQNSHGTDNKDRYSEEELREIETANKENIRKWEERRSKRRSDSGGV